MRAVRRSGGGIRTAAVALPPAALALALGLWGVTRRRSIWDDEAVTWAVAHRSPGRILALAPHIDAVHTLYYLLMHAVFRLLPDDLTVLRLPAVLGVAVAAATTALIGRRLAGPRAGLLAGLLLPVFPAVQQNAQEGRSYGLVCGGVATATLLLLRALDRPRSPARWAAYAATLAATCLLHEFAAPVLAAHALTLHLAQRRAGVRVCDCADATGGWHGRRGRRGLAAACSGGWGCVKGTAAVRDWRGRRGSARGGGDGVAAIGPVRGGRWLPGGWVCAAVAVVVPLVPLAWLSSRESHQIAWIPAPAPATWAFAVGLAAVGGACALLPGVRADGGTAAVAVPLLTVPQGALMIWSLAHPVYLDRYVLYEYAGLALLLGAALEQLARHSRRIGWRAVLAVPLAVLVLLPLELHQRTPQDRQDDLAAASRAVAAEAGPGPRSTGVLFLPAAHRLSALADPADYRGLRDLALARTGTASDTLFGTETDAATLAARLATVTRVVTVASPRRPSGRIPETVRLDRAKLALLQAHFTLRTRTRVQGLIVTLYIRRR